MDLYFFAILMTLIGFFAGYKTYRNPEEWRKIYGCPPTADIKLLNVKWTKILGIFMMIFFAFLFLLFLVRL